MRIVTVAAVLGDRLMFPEKRAAVFGVTGGASLIDGVFNQLRRRGGTVWRMTRGAGHRAFAQRMMRRLQRIAVLCLMTGGADLNLGCRRLHWIFGRMQLMATRAGNIACGMSARRPIMRCIRLVADQALRVLLGSGCARLGAEVDHARQRAASRLHVCAARPVAGLALQAAMSEGTARIIRAGMLGAEDAGDGQ